MLAVVAVIPSVLVRLPNYVGDVVLSIPAIRHLQSAGFRPVLIGRGWAADLLRPMLANGWVVQPYPSGLRMRLQSLRALRSTYFGSSSARPMAVSLPNGFSGALEYRLAGFATVGYAKEWRSPLLAQALQLVAETHEMDAFARLAYALTGQPFVEGALESVWRDHPYYEPDEPAVAAWSQRSGRFNQAGNPDYVVLCPFAGGKTFEGQPKQWPEFEMLANRLRLAGHRVFVFPGNADERLQARERFAQCQSVDDVGLPELAQWLRHAKLVVANDTGPGHLAAAVGARLLTVGGPGFPNKYRPRGPRVQVLHTLGQWPPLLEVERAAMAILTTS